MLSLLIILALFHESLYSERRTRDDIKSLILGEWKNCEIQEGKTRLGLYIFSFKPQFVVQRNEKDNNGTTNPEKGSWAVDKSRTNPDELVVIIKFNGGKLQYYTIVEADERFIRLRSERASRAGIRTVIKLYRDEE